MWILSFRWQQQSQFRNSLKFEITTLIMEISGRKTKIIKAILETKNEGILDLLEEDLNISGNSSNVDVSELLSPRDIDELKTDLAEKSEQDTVSEKEFWNLVNAWNKQ